MNICISLNTVYLNTCVACLYLETYCIQMPMFHLPVITCGSMLT